MKAGVLDLQSYIPSLKPHFSHTYLYEEFGHTATESSIEFSAPATTITSVHILRTTGVESRARVTYDAYQQKLPTTRVDDVPKVSFRSCAFEVRPPLIEDEKVMVRYVSEVSTFDDDDLVPYDERCAKLVASYAKAHITREVDKDLTLYSSYMEDYFRERAIYHLDRAEYTPECMDDTQIIKYNSPAMSTQAENVTAAENLFAGDVITIAPDGARRAEALAGYSADGFIAADVLSGVSAAVHLEGTLRGTGGAPGLRYYLSNVPGQVTSVSPPSGISQYIGKGLSDTEINFEPDQPVHL